MDCPRCGKFWFDNAAWSAATIYFARTPEKDARRTRFVASHFIRRTRPADRGSPIPATTEAAWGEILSQLLPTHEEQADNLLKWIGKELPTHGEKTWLPPLEISAVIGAADNGPELDFIVSELKEKKYLTGEVLQKEGGMFQHHVGLSFNGWSAYKRLVAEPAQKPAPAADQPAIATSYVSSIRLEALRAIKSKDFDLTKLVRLCEELNSSFAAGNYFSVAMLVRAILDHVPPIFGSAGFTSVIGSHGGKSFKEQMTNLDNSSRKIADAALHEQIRRRDVLPTDTQVNFASLLDRLLGEIVAKLTT
jgi:hypothetical protein